MSSGGWDVVRDAVRAQIGPHAYDAWFRTLEGRLLEGRLVIRCPDRFSRDWIRGRYGEALERVAPGGCAIEYEIAAPGRGRIREKSTRQAPGAQPTKGDAPDPRARGEGEDPRPVRRAAALDSFVAGDGNALALEAARAVARGQAGRCSPLFISGATGLGKTHLCRAIWTEIGAEAVYRSSEEFTTEVTQAIRAREMQKVRQRYRRSANVLILEDIQFLAGKKQTQVELFHTLDHLLSAGKPVVLSADRLPQEIRDLDAKLASRMAAGLVTRLEPPGLAARRQILRDKAAGGGVRLPDPCLEMLASRPVDSVRDLLAGLNQVVARAALLDQSISLSLVAEALAAVEVPGPTRSIEEITARLARAYGLGVTDLRSRSRRRSVSRPRQFAMYLCRRYTDASLKEIGRAFERDHTSVMYAVEAVERRIVERPQLRYELEALVKRL